MTSGAASKYILPVRRTIALLGMALVVSGLMLTDIFKTLPGAVSTHNAITLAFMLMAAALISVLARIRLIDAIPAVILLLAIRFIDPAAILAATLILGAATVIGHYLSRGFGKLETATSTVCGIAVLTGVAGWLLPFKVHTFLAYLLVLGCIAMTGRRILRHTLRVALSQWRRATNDAPVCAAFAITAVALCTVALLPPTVQFDDLALHILLPEQLATLGHYKMDVASQAWAVAPWASDLLQGYVAVLSGSDARGAANAIWLLLTLIMLWQLGGEIGLKANLRWLAMALYATLPVVNALNGSMQSDTAITTAAVTLVTLTARIIRTRRGALLTPFMVVCGLLMALKTTSALLIASMALIALWHIGPGRFVKGALYRLPMAVGICGSSYAYAWHITGNPVFPLFNGWFRSPYAPATNFDDPRWHQGLSWDSLWQITFHTSKYQEAYPGAFGFALLALAGCVLLGLRLPKVRWLIIGLLFSLVSMFAGIQYARYLTPFIAPLLPLALLAWQDLGLRRGGEWMLAGVAILNAIFIPAAGYPLTDDINWKTFSNINRTPAETTTLIERQYAVESLISRHLALAWPHGYSLYLANPERPFNAPFLGQAISRSWYDPGMLAAAQKADEDRTGDAWLQLFERTGMTHVLTMGDTKGALGAALQRAGATPETSIDDSTLWRLCKSNCTMANHPLLEQRDTSKRLLQ